MAGFKTLQWTTLLWWRVCALESETLLLPRLPQVKRIYEPQLLQNCGIRLIDPEVFGGYSPAKKLFLQQVILRPIFFVS